MCNQAPNIGRILVGFSCWPRSSRAFTHRMVHWQKYTGLYTVLRINYSLQIWQHENGVRPVNLHRIQWTPQGLVKENDCFWLPGHRWLAQVVACKMVSQLILASFSWLQVIVSIAQSYATFSKCYKLGLGSRCLNGEGKATTNSQMCSSFTYLT
jgi:hypothetical protein